MRTFPTARIISFEPNLLNTDALCRVADHFPGRVSVERVALSDIDGEAQLFWPVYNGQPLSTLASFNITAAGSWLADNMPWFDPEKLKVEHVSVVTKRLDSLNLRPDIIKIDVEGSESRVIRGGLGTIEACRPIIMAESLDSDALDALRLFKYRAVESRTGMSRARIVVSDFIVVRS
jgi:FkbM family methyltransferase